MNGNQIVIKPWGFEYKCFSNDEVAIWVLEIDKGKATSLHCHPRKNTALIILQGVIELSFIRDATPHRFRGLDKINIFRGRFHRTKAVSDGVVLLEVEAPDDKRDIVRLEDDYNRVADPIEEATIPLDNSCLQIQDSLFGNHYANCLMEIIHPKTTIPQTTGQHVFVTLSGGLEHGLVPVGDAIDGLTFARFTQSFKPVPGTSFLHIWKMQS